MPQAIAGAIGFLAFNAGVSLAVVNAITLVIVPALIKAGIGLAVSALTTALTRRSTPAIKPSDGQQEIRQEVGPRRRSFGRLRLSGSIWWYATDPTDPDTAMVGYVFNHGRIGQIVQRYIDRNEVEVDVNDRVTTPPYHWRGDDEMVYMLSRLGLATESAYSEISTKFGVTNCRGDGLFTMLVTIDNFENAEAQLDVWPNNIPEIHILADTSVVFDPREVGHDHTDETTWEYTNNPVVCLFHYYFVDPDGYGMNYARVENNLPEWIAAMDLCDEAVTLDSGGTEARYRLAMSYYLTDDPVDVAARIIASCDARVWPRRNGQIGIAVGAFIRPKVIIESKDIVAYNNFSRGQGKLARVAGIRAQYLSPDHEYVEQDAESWPDGATVLGFVGDRTINLDLTMCPSMTQARRLMKREYIRQNPNWRGSIVTNLSGLRAIDERFVTVVIDELGINETFEIANFQFDYANLTVTIDVLSVADTIDDWDEATEEGTPPADDPLKVTEIDPSTETPIGNMTSGGGLAAAFDGNTNQNDANSATRTDQTDGYVGLTFSTPRRIKNLIAHASNNRGFAHETSIPENAVATLRLYAKTGSAPANSTDGTLLGTLALSSDPNSYQATISSNDRVTIWDHAWLRVTKTDAGTNPDVLCAELRLFE